MERRRRSRQALVRRMWCFVQRIAGKLQRTGTPDARPTRRTCYASRMAISAADPGAVAAPLSRRRLLGMAGAVWLTFGLVQCAQSWVQAQATGRAWDLAGALITGMPWWLSWFLLTPLLMLLAERLPMTGARPWRAFGGHVVAGVVISCVNLAAVGTVYWFTTGHTLGIASSLPNQIQRFFGSFFLESIVTYAAAVGVLVAIDFARAARDERVTRAELEVQAAVLETAVARARLAALTMELNPHFLFNTLSAISGLVAQARPAEAREVVRRLGELLRRTLETGADPFHTMARELDFLEDYLFIQQVRFSDRLDVTLDIDAHARSCTIPALLLQPLVENAIRHGIEPNAGRGDVRIQITRNDGSLRIAIADSGAGFDDMLLREGVGIANTRARLDHLYGIDAALHLRNRPDGGAEAVVLMPARDR